MLGIKQECAGRACSKHSDDLSVNMLMTSITGKQRSAWMTMLRKQDEDISFRASRFETRKHEDSTNHARTLKTLVPLCPHPASISHWCSRWYYMSISRGLLSCVGRSAWPCGWSWVCHSRYLISSHHSAAIVAFNPYSNYISVFGWRLNPRMRKIVRWELWDQLLIIGCAISTNITCTLDNKPPAKTMQQSAIGHWCIWSFSHFSRRICEDDVKRMIWSVPSCHGHSDHRSMRIIGNRLL